MAKTTFHLGGEIDPKSGERTDASVLYEANDLTIHGVIVGMTGSGKTGLGMIYLEEALRNGIPTLIIDPKGDMTNLMLTFPELAPEDFAPWVDTTEASREGKDIAEMAEATAKLWRSGLESWDLSGDDIAALRDRVGMTLYTPGSTAGVPIDVLGSLKAPEGDFSAASEIYRDEIEGLVSGLLALVGVESDPLSGREHILLSTLVEHAWTAGDDLTLEDLIVRVSQPPIRKLGVFEMDTFFPEKDRMALAMRLNSLVASPSFAAWRSGPPLDPGSMLWDSDGKPQASILYLAHLSDDERQFVVTMVLSRLITWMRSQTGTGDLRALVYMDEVFGFVPPTAMPPAKKPILTLMKQARAFGIGMLLSTQNPIDLDYKAMSNAGTWCIGRLQTERDKARILEALQSAGGGSDISRLDPLISGLGKRQFLLHNTRSSEPTVFTTRWAMSYLRGPLTRDQVSTLVGEDKRRTAAAQSTPKRSETDATPLAPTVAGGTNARHVDPGAPWLESLGAKRNSSKFGAGLAVRVRLKFDDTKASVDHSEEWEAVYYPLSDPFDPSTATLADHDPRDFREGQPDGAQYQLTTVPVDSKAWFGDVATSVRDYLFRNRTITVFHNPTLKLYSRVGESAEDFKKRCESTAQDKADGDIAAAAKRFQARIDRAKDAIDAAYLKVQEARLDAETRRQEEVASGASTIISVLMGRKNSRSMSTAASKRSMTRKAEQRVESAEMRVLSKQEALSDLEADLAEAVAEAKEKWIDMAADITEVDIGLEKTDISVDDPVLIWIPI